MKISEIFYSLQGEGRLTGMPSVFVRIAGCPLRCRWCDTPYALDENDGEELSVEQIVSEVAKYETKYVVVTGGEPMIEKQLPDLLGELKRHGKHITIETAGIAYWPDLPCDLMSISPKLSSSNPTRKAAASSHAAMRLNIPILSDLIHNYPYQLKFVVDCEKDLAEIKEIVEQLGDVSNDNVMLMPQALTRRALFEKSPMVAEMCRRTGFGFSNRLHIMLWNGKRGV